MTSFYFQGLRKCFLEISLRLEVLLQRYLSLSPTDTKRRLFICFSRLGKNVTKMCFSKGGILWRFVIKICLIKRSTEVIRNQWQNFLQDPRISLNRGTWLIFPNALEDFRADKYRLEQVLSYYLSNFLRWCSNILARTGIVLTDQVKYIILYHSMESLVAEKKYWLRAMVFFQGRQLCQNCYLPIWEGVYSKRKEFAPIGSKFFPFRVDQFSGGDWCAERQIVPSLVKNGGNSSQNIKSP